MSRPYSKFTRDKQKAFLDAIRGGQGRVEAAALAGVCYVTAASAYKRDLVFRASVAKAERQRGPLNRRHNFCPLGIVEVKEDAACVARWQAKGAKWWGDEEGVAS